MAKLTKRLVDSLETKKKPYIVYDQIIPGLCIRILPSGRRSYYLQYMKHRTTRRFLLGQHGVITTEQARDKSISTIAEIKAGGDPQLEKAKERRSPLVQDLVKKFVTEHVAVHCKINTQKRCNHYLQKYILPFLGKMKVSDITRANISAMHHSLRHIPESANHCVSISSKMFNLAEVWEMRSEGTNPCRHVKKFQAKARDRYLSKEEAKRLGDVLDELKQYPDENLSAVYCIQLLLLTGCRLGEIQTLKWEHIDYEKKFLRLPDSKTGAKVVYIGDAVISLLHEIKEHPRRQKDNSFVICKEKSKDEHLHNIHSPWRRFCKLAGLDDLHIHDLRHSFASFAVNSGMSLPMIGKLLGHTQARTTSRYAHLMAEPMLEAANSVANKLGAILQVNADTKPEKKEMPIPNFKTVSGTAIATPTYLTSMQAAEYLNVKHRLMEYWRCQKTGPAFIKVGSRVRYKLETLKEFVNARLELATE